MPFDPKTNFAYGTVTVAPSPASSGLTLTIDHPSRFPDPDADGAFNLVVWPAGVALPLPSNATIVRATGLAAGVFVILRAQEGSSARSILVGDQVALAATAKTFTDIEQSLIPIAAPASAVIDSTTYDNPIGPGKLTTLVMPSNQPVMAIAIEGDAFPRWLWNADALDGIYLGDGTYDPYLGGVAIVVGGTAAHPALLLEGGGGNMQLGARDVTAGTSYVSASTGIRPNFAAVIFSGYDIPTQGGRFGDIYIRADGDVGSTIYRCTVEGLAGVAVWTAIL